jgi:hypothetical protein
MTTTPGRQSLDREPDSSLSRRFAVLSIGDTYDYFDLKNVHRTRPDIPVHTLWVRAIKSSEKSCMTLNAASWGMGPDDECFNCEPAQHRVAEIRHHVDRGDGEGPYTATTCTCGHVEWLRHAGSSTYEPPRDFVESRFAKSHLQTAWRASLTKT